MSQINKRQFLKASLGTALVGTAALPQPAFSESVNSSSRRVPFSGALVTGEIEIFHDMEQNRDRAFVRLAVDRSGRFVFPGGTGLPTFFMGHIGDEYITLGINEATVTDGAGKLIDRAPFAA